MKKKLSLFLVTFLAVFAIAFAKTLEDKSVTYALTEGDTFTSGQTVEVKNGTDVVATITYGEDGGEAFKAAKADKNIEGFTAFTEGNGTNGNKTGGTFYTITPKFDGTIEVAVALNADKAFYIEEDGTALADYNGIKVTEKYYGIYKFTAKADKSYKIYCAGSKLGFYGFKYNYAVDDDDPTPVETKTIYMRPGVWASADAVTRYAVYAFNESDNAWFDLAEVKDDEGTFSADIPTNYTGIILVRMDGTKPENNWDNKWNQTADIDFAQTADNTLFTIDAQTWEDADKKTPYTTSEYTGPEAPAQKYTVLVDNGMVFGTVEADKYEAAEGEQVALKVLVKEEYQDTYELDALTVTGVDESPIETHEIVGSDYNYGFTMPAQNVTVSATFKEIAQQVEINSMGIRGTFPGLSWDEDLQMRPADDGNKTWIATMENVEVEAKTYEYKATANGQWGVCELPAQGNANFEFGTDKYPAGKYNLTFTANVEENTIELVAEKVEEPQPVESVVLDFTAQGYENGQEVTSLTVDPVTVTLDKGTNSNSPKYYSTGDAVRLYGGGTMTVSSKTNISNITITFGTSDGTNEITASPGTYKDGVWTGDAKEVVFTIGGTTGNRRFQKLEVTLGEGGGDQPVVDTYTATFKTNLGWKPVYAYAWSGEGEAVEEFLGEWPGTEMTPADELDNGYGINFTAAEAPAFIIFNDGTKEGAVEGVNKTADLAFVNGKDYSLIDNSIKTIAQLNALANKTEFTFTGKAIVVAKMEGESSQTIDNYIYIKDETGSSLIYDKGGAHSNESDKTKGLLVGDVITAPWNGTVSIYKNLFEVRPAGDEQLTASENVGEVTYPEATPDDVTAENVNKVVEIKGLTIYNVDGKNIKFTIGDDLVNGWNQFGIELPEVTEGKTFDVVGAISRYNDNIQFQPFTITEVEPQLNTYTATFTTNLGWKPVYAYAYNYTPADEAEGVQEHFYEPVEWPGTPMTLNAETGVYEVAIESAEEPNLIIFNDGTKEGSQVGINQTPNWEFENEKAYDYSTQPFAVSFTTDKEWKQVFAYTWSGDNVTAAKVEQLGKWPGREITESLKEGVYTYEFEAIEAPDSIIFNNGLENEAKEQTGNLTFVNGKTYTFSEEKVTAWAGNPDVAIEETGIIIPAKAFANDEVQAEKIIHIVAKEISTAAPAKGFNSDVAELKPTDIAILKNEEPFDKVLIEETAIQVVDDGYQFVADNAVAQEITDHGFVIKPLGDKQIGIEYVEVEKAKAPAAVVNIDFAPAPTDDIGAVIEARAAEITAAGNKVGNITITLGAIGTPYTTTKAIVAPAGVLIQGAGPATSIIDASGLEGDLITLSGSETFAKKADDTDSDHYLIGSVEINNLKIAGLKGTLITDAQKTLLEKLTINNAVVEMPAAAKNVINFNGKGYVGEVVVKNSTIYANGHNTGFFAQYGSRPKNVNGDWLQTFDVQNSTIVGIAYGKNVCDLKQNGTAQNVYTLKNNIFVDFGKSGQVVVGFNKGQTSATPVWNVDNNIFNYDGADKAAAEVEKAGKVGEEDIVKNSVAGVVTFTNAATGDFNGTFALGEGASEPATKPGDPRWTYTYESTAPAKFYLIGSMNNWDRTALTEMTFNETTQAYEYEYAPTEKVWFAFADKQLTADEAAADPEWADFNANHRYAIGSGDVNATLNEAIALQKINGTLVLEAGSYKISVAKDLSTVTITGEAPEHTYTVAGSFYYAEGSVAIFGTEWDVANTANDMEKQLDGTYKKVYTIDFPFAGNIQFKVAENHAWDVSYGWDVTAENPDGNAFYAVASPATGATVTITFDPNGATAADKVKIEVTGIPTVGISGIATDDADDNAPIYNLAGQKVDKNYKGVVIKNGKKVYQK